MDAMPTPALSAPADALPALMAVAAASLDFGDSPDDWLGVESVHPLTWLPTAESASTPG